MRWLFLMRNESACLNMLSQTGVGTEELENQGISQSQVQGLCQPIVGLPLEGKTIYRAQEGVSPLSIFDR